MSTISIRLSEIIASHFSDVHKAIKNNEYMEYVLKGGRGSTKSSFIAVEVVLLIKQNPKIHALITRQVKDTLKDSVYAQIVWAIDTLSLSHEFKCTKSPLEIVYRPTGQTIYFRGADDPFKIKSIKPPFGYIGILWEEELDQFKGEEATRSIEQSALRGGDKAWLFKSFNPPKTNSNWANKYSLIEKPNRLVHHSTYQDVPSEWLGKIFIEEAEFLKDINPKAYEHEYLGIANGTGGSIFENVTVRPITDEEISQFDRIYHGLDFGWYPDPAAYTKSHYHASGRKLFIFDEFGCNKQSNRQIYESLTSEKNLSHSEEIICDSAEPKSVADLRSYGLRAVGAEKGPGSVDRSMKWLQGLTEIIIDPRRCPEAAKEFLNYEWEKNKQGEIITGYPDADNHYIDSIRYATNRIWRKKGI